MFIISVLWTTAFDVVVWGFFLNKILKQFILFIKEQNLIYSLFHSKFHITLVNLFFSTSYSLLLPYPSANS